MVCLYRLGIFQSVRNTVYGFLSRCSKRPSLFSCRPGNVWWTPASNLPGTVWGPGDRGWETAWALLRIPTTYLTTNYQKAPQDALRLWIPVTFLTSLCFSRVFLYLCVFPTPPSLSHPTSHPSANPLNSTIRINQKLTSLFHADPTALTRPLDDWPFRPPTALLSLTPKATWILPRVEVKKY